MGIICLECEPQSNSDATRKFMNIQSVPWSCIFPVSFGLICSPYRLVTMDDYFSLLRY